MTLSSPSRGHVSVVPSNLPIHCSSEDKGYNENPYGHVGLGVVQPCAFSVFLLQHAHSNSFGQRSMYINGAACAACDVLITIALVVILRKSKARMTAR